jgi:hypothetical protein
MDGQSYEGLAQGMIPAALLVVFAGGLMCGWMAWRIR